MSHPPPHPARWLPTTAFVILSLAAVPAAAQQAASTTTSNGTKSAPNAATAASDDAKAAADNNALVIPQIDVSGAGLSAEAPYRTPAAVSTVGQGEIDTFTGHSLGDVLRTIPGTFTRENMQNPGIAVNIRGFEGSGRVNMMIDGVRQNFRFTGHEAQGFTYVDPALLAGVDVQRGAVSTTGGAGALAGTANFRTLGIDDIIQAGKTWGAVGNLSWGTNGTGWSEMAGLGAYLGPNAAIAGAVSHNDTNNYQNGDGVSQPYTAQNLTSGLFKARIDPTEDTRLAVGGVLYNNTFGANSYNQTVNSQTYTSNFTYTPDNPLIDFGLNGYYNQVDMTYDSPITVGSYTGRNVTDEGWGFDTSNTSRFDLGPVGVAAVYGAEWFQDYVSTVKGGVNPSGDAGTGGVFSQTTFSYGIVDFIAGLRYDYYDLDGNGTSQTQGGAYTVDQSEGRFDPKLTLAVNPLDWLQVYGSWSESFRPPTTFETLLGGNHPGSTTTFFPNPDLDPETQRGWEVGLNALYKQLFTQTDVATFKIDYYRMNVENYITAECARVGKYYGCYFDNVPGTTYVQGVELQGGYDMGVAFGQVSYTYTNTDMPAQMNGLGAQSYLPDNMATVTLGTRWLDSKLTVGGRGNFVSSSYIGDINAGATGDDRVAGYSTWDAFASYQVNANLKVGVDATNLLDKLYTPALSTSGSGMGRTVVFNMKATF